MHQHPARAVELGAERFANRRGSHPGRPKHGGRAKPATAGDDAIGVDLGHERIGTHLHADLVEIAVGLARQRFREGGQNARRSLEQENACPGRIDPVELPRQRVARDLTQRARQLDPGRSAANHHEGQQAVALDFVLGTLGVLERAQHPPADLERVLQALQPRGVRLPVVMSEIGMPRTGGKHQIVVGNRTSIGMQNLLVGIDRDRFRHQDRSNIFLPAQDRTDWLGDIRRRKRCGCDLVEQRLEGVMVAAVHHDDLNRGVFQRLNHPQSAESGPDDDDAGLPWCCRHDSNSGQQGTAEAVHSNMNELRLDLTNDAKFEIAFYELNDSRQHLVCMRCLIADADDA